MKTVYLSLGSNLGDRQRHLLDAIAMLETPRLHVTRVSGIYETEPQDLRTQPWFLNLVLEAETKLFPMQLLSLIQRIESDLGRQRKVSKGPRTLDIDILLYGNFIINSDRLMVPHPHMHERRFVLEPLVELAPNLRHPLLRRSMRELLGAVEAQSVRKLEL